MFPPNSPLMQGGVFALGFFQDGDIRVGVLPQCQEILVSNFGFCGIAGERVGAARTEMCQSTYRVVDDHAAVIEKFLVFDGRFLALLGKQVSCCAGVNRMKAMVKTLPELAWPDS